MRKNEIENCSAKGTELTKIKLENCNAKGTELTEIKTRRFTGHRRKALQFAPYCIGGREKGGQRSSPPYCIRGREKGDQRGSPRTALGDANGDHAVRPGTAFGFAVADMCRQHVLTGRLRMQYRANRETPSRG